MATHTSIAMTQWGRTRPMSHHHRHSHQRPATAACPYATGPSSPPVRGAAKRFWNLLSTTDVGRWIPALAEEGAQNEASEWELRGRREMEKERRQEAEELGAGRNSRCSSSRPPSWPLRKRSRVGVAVDHAFEPSMPPRLPVTHIWHRFYPLFAPLRVERETSLNSA